MVELTILSPLSEVRVGNRNAPRLDTLNGKTICEVWATGHYGADLTFPTVREKLRERFPDVNIVPYTEFPIGKPKATERWAPLPEVEGILRAKGCDAVIAGNGG